MKEFMTTLWQDESGQDLAEYAILLGIITIAVIVIIGTIGTQITNIFTRASTEIGAVPGAGG
jgi:Flp pilus assembly pilin Flp